MYPPLQSRKRCAPAFMVSPDRTEREFSFQTPFVPAVELNWILNSLLYKCVPEILGCRSHQNTSKLTCQPSQTSTRAQPLGCRLKHRLVD